MASLSCLIPTGFRPRVPRVYCESSPLAICTPTASCKECRSPSLVEKNMQDIGSLSPNQRYSSPQRKQSTDDGSIFSAAPRKRVALFSLTFRKTALASGGKVRAVCDCPQQAGSIRGVGYCFIFRKVVPDERRNEGSDRSRRWEEW